MPAKFNRKNSRKQRKQSLHERNKKPQIGKILLIVSLMIFFSVIAIYFVLSAKSSLWNKFDSQLIINAVNNDGLSILSIDRKNNTISQMLVDGNIVFEVSNNFGKYRVKNLYELDRSQKFNGLLMVTSVQKNLYAPLFLWTKHDLTEIKISRPMELLSFLSDSSSTNINIADRLLAAAYLLRKNKSIIKENINHTGFTKSNNPNDGGEVLMNDLLPNDLALLWTNGYVSENQVRFEIINNSNERLLPESIYKIFETSGAKVANIIRNSSKNNESNGLCVVKSKDELLLEYYSKIFKCQKEIGDVNEPFNFTIEMNQALIDVYK